MIGLVFLVFAMVFGKIGVNILSAIPNSVLGVLLLFAGLELTLLLKDIMERKDLFVAFSIAGISLATRNMGIAFVAGMVLERLIRARKLDV